MGRDELVYQIQEKKSFLCIGLDTDISKIPSHLLTEQNPVLSFNKIIIDATQHLTVAYKINTAFYEATGVLGWETMSKTIEYINSKYPHVFTIADAKRGDIGNTSDMYAKTFFETFDFNAITASPYMGFDSIEPFLKYQNKHTILLALTSNQGAYDFQTEITNTGEKVFEMVIRKSIKWENSENLMYVVGATKATELENIRKIIPHAFLLIPGIGVQGGNLQEVCKYGLNKQVGLLINSSRGIIYASNKKDFVKTAQKEAQRIQHQMAQIIESVF